MGFFKKCATSYCNLRLKNLYDSALMPAELRKAHAANDRAVMKAYGFQKDMTEIEIISELFRMYEEMTQK